MLDYSEYKPKNRFCLAGRIGIRRRGWIRIVLAAAAYLPLAGIECLLAEFAKQATNP